MLLLAKFNEQFFFLFPSQLSSLPVHIRLHLKYIVNTGTMQHVMGAKVEAEK
jgi:hypothetical protein